MNILVDFLGWWGMCEIRNEEKTLAIVFILAVSLFVIGSEIKMV